jgi:protein SCO1/2
MGYVVDHSADLYVIDRDGKLQGSIRHGAPPREILQVLRRALGTDTIIEEHKSDKSSMEDK